MFSNFSLKKLENEKKNYIKKRKIISVTEETLKVSTKPAQLKTIYTLIIIMKIRSEILYNHLFLSFFFSDLNSHSDYYNEKKRKILS
jgi:hypothetical protein